MVEPDGRERLVYVPGDVALPRYPDWSLADEALVSTAALLLGFRDATVWFRLDADVGTDWVQA